MIISGKVVKPPIVTTLSSKEKKKVWKESNWDPPNTFKQQTKKQKQKKHDRGWRKIPIMLQQTKMALQYLCI